MSNEKRCGTCFYWESFGLDDDFPDGRCRWSPDEVGIDSDLPEWFYTAPRGRHRRDGERCPTWEDK